MGVIAKIVSGALLAGFVAVGQPSVSLACDKDGQAKEEKKKDEDTVAQREREDQSKKKGDQTAPTDNKDRKGATDPSRTN